MTEETKVTPKEGEKWVTVRGKHVMVDPDADAEEKLREKVPSARGEKEKATKEAQREIRKRFNLIKTPFRMRDEVCFDNFTKEGIVFGFDGDYLKIKTVNGSYDRLANNVFKKSELIKGIHWDAMTDRNRFQAVQKSHVSRNYVNQDWATIPRIVRDNIIKNLGPAGYEGGISTSTTGVYNPVNDDKTVHERIEENLKEQHTKKEKPEEKKKPDPKEQVVD